MDVPNGLLSFRGDVMITARNYAAQVEKVLKDATYDKTELRLMALDIIKNSQHFAIPDKGTILNDKIKGLVDKPINLPFDCVTLEYYNPPLDTYDLVKDEYITKSILLARQDETSIYVLAMGYLPRIKDWAISKCIFIVKRNSLCKDEGIKYDVVFPDNFDKYANQESLDNHEKFTRVLFHPLFELLEALTCKNVYFESLEGIDLGKNERRIKQGKVPFYETKILCVKSTGSEIDKSWKGESHASPRQHLRRGHIRRYEEYSIWINDQVIGKAENGRIDKSYAVK